MNTRFLFIALLVAVLITPTSIALGNPGQPDGPGSVSGQREGGPITIEYTTHDADEPAVAYSSQHDQYLVVYQYQSSGGDINLRGQFVNAKDGTTIGSAFEIASSPTTREAAPDVAYDSTNDRFLVVYESSLIPRDVVGVLLYGSHQSGSQIASSAPISIASGGTDDEYNPAVAYNADDDQFMVVYIENEHLVNGRMISSHASAPTLLGTGEFPLSLVTADLDYRKPDIAWGSGGNTFMVVMEMFDTNTNNQSIKGRLLHDTHQSSGDQTIGFLIEIAPSTPLTGSSSDPAIAHDPLNDKYVIVFTYIEFGEKLIYATRYQSNTTTRVGGFITIDTDSTPNTSFEYPSIAFTGVSSFMRVAYAYKDWNSTPQYMIYSRILTGTDARARKEVLESMYSAAVDKTAIAGSRIGRTLIAWRQKWSDTDHDIYAQRMVPFWTNLPAVFRNY